jgi:hypothetical protein
MCIKLAELNQAFAEPVARAIARRRLQAEDKVARKDWAAVERQSLCYATGESTRGLDGW